MTDKMKTIGSRAEVWHSTAKKTSGGLKKADLMKHKGRIVSRKAHANGKKAIKRLFALGYKPKKGTFKAMRKSMVNGRKKKRGTRKRGGADILTQISEAVGSAGVPSTLTSGSGTGPAEGFAK
jgi:hypothetical protein